MADLNNVTKQKMPKVNVYTVLTLILTLIMIGVTVTAIIALPYFNFKIAKDGTEGSIGFIDTFQYLIYFITIKLGKNIEPAAALSTDMAAFAEVIKGMGNLSFVTSLVVMVGAILQFFALLAAIVILALTLKGFLSGNFLSFRRGQRHIGTMTILAFVPSIVLQILLLVSKQANLITLGSFVLVVVALVEEIITSVIYHKHLKNVEVLEAEPATENIIVSQDVETEEPKVEETAPETVETPAEAQTPVLAAPETTEQVEECCECSCCCGCSEEQPETKLCPNCGHEVSPNDKFCQNCGAKIEEVKEEETMPNIFEMAEKKEETCTCTQEPCQEPCTCAEQPKEEQSKEDVKVLYVDNNGENMENKTVETTSRKVIKLIGLPLNLKELGDHRFSKNGQLQVARIPSNITELGIGCFANCYNLLEVYIPISVKKICANALFATQKLKKITYEGTIDQFRHIERDTNWLTASGTDIIHCADGDIRIQ